MAKTIRPDERVLRRKLAWLMNTYHITAGHCVHYCPKGEEIGRFRFNNLRRQHQFDTHLLPTIAPGILTLARLRGHEGGIETTQEEPIKPDES